MSTANTVASAFEPPPIEMSADPGHSRASSEHGFSWNGTEPEVVADPEEIAPNGAAREGWEHLGLRGDVAKLIFERGYEKSAARFANCQRFGRPGVCSRYPDEHRYFQRHGCGMRLCSNCAQEERRRLFDKYLAVLSNVLAQLTPLPKGWVLARITFTLRSNGSAITPEKVKLFNSAVRGVMKTTARILGEDNRYGMLFIDEVGSELNGLRCERTGNGLNLHCHGLYIGPRLDWGKTRDLWMAITTEKFGAPSCGFNITGIRWFSKHPMRAVRFGLNCLLKYVSKPPAVSAERLADLICAFHGTRRVHSLGMFYGVRLDSDNREISCPQCQELGIPSTISFEGRYLSNGSCIPRLVLVRQLEATGYRDLQEVRRKLFFARDHASP